MKPKERIPLHDHVDGNSGGKIDRAQITEIAAGVAPSSGAAAHSLDGPQHLEAMRTDQLLATEDHAGLLLPLSGDGNDSLRGDGTWAASGASLALLKEGGEGHALFTEDDCGASIALDLDSYNAFDLGLTEACTFSFTSTTAVAGQRHTWAIGLRGDFDVTWPASVVWRDTDGTETATPPAMSGAFNAVEINTLDGGTSFGAVLDNGGGAAATSSPLTTKGDLWGFDTADNRVPVGTDGYPLVASSAAALGVAYTTLAAAAYPFHAEPLCDSSGPILEASGDVIMVIGVPN